MPRYVGPSHGPNGLTLEFALRDPAGKASPKIGRLAVRSPQDLVLLIFNGQDLREEISGDSRISVCRLSRVRPERRNMTESDLLCRLKLAVDGEPGYDIMMDAEDAGTRLPLPDTDVLRMYVIDGQKTLKFAEPSLPARIVPVTNRDRRRPGDEAAVRDRLSKLIAEAMKEYFSRAEAADWTAQDFAAAYLTEHGAWADLNWSDRASRPVGAWIRKE